MTSGLLSLLVYATSLSHWVEKADNCTELITRKVASDYNSGETN